MRICIRNDLGIQNILYHLTFWMLLFSTADYSTSEMLVNMGNLPLDEFYPAVAIVTLMRILRDPSLSNHHTMVVQAVTFIFKSLGLKCVQFLPQVMPTFLNVIRVCDASIREVQSCKCTFSVQWVSVDLSGHSFVYEVMLCTNNI